jgi:hypothetical protein
LSRQGDAASRAGFGADHPGEVAERAGRNAAQLALRSLQTFHRGLLGAVKRTPRSRWNAGFGSDSGPSRSDPCRPALRPFATYICIVESRSLAAFAAARASLRQFAKFQTLLTNCVFIAAAVA